MPPSPGWCSTVVAVSYTMILSLSIFPNTHKYLAVWFQQQATWKVKQKETCLSPWQKAPKERSWWLFTDCFACGASILLAPSWSDGRLSPCPL